MRRLSNKSTRIRTSFSGAILRLSCETQRIGTSFIYVNIYIHNISIYIWTCTLTYADRHTCICIYIHISLSIYIYICFTSCSSTSACLGMHISIPNPLHIRCVIAHPRADVLKHEVTHIYAYLMKC